jgi:hypothetical protein
VSQKPQLLNLTCVVVVVVTREAYEVVVWLVGGEEVAVEV